MTPVTFRWARMPGNQRVRWFLEDTTTRGALIVDIAADVPSAVEGASQAARLLGFDIVDHLPAEYLRRP